jgi:ATP adenylyltransferase
MQPPLWAPWRMDYILAKKGGSCVFCGVDSASEAELSERFILCRGAHAFVVLNRYPFAAGHLLVIPYRHVSRLDELEEPEVEGLFRLLRGAVRALERAVAPQGLNVGFNLGAAAGAGIAEHLHAHIVPRWAGDTNFMPVLADTRVVPQALEATLAQLRPHFEGLDEGPSPPSPAL